MANFDFVADDDLRVSLESDAAEMAACHAQGAYKASHVLAGSIVEAVLVDHLAATGYADPKGRDVRTLALGDLIAVARSQDALSDTAASLASVVKSYRNLIHPGRAVRLKEKTVDEDTSAIAGHMVGVIAREVAARRQLKLGFTAQALATKVETDSSCLSILSELLAKTHEREVRKLLLMAIPTRFLELARNESYGDETDATMRRLGRAHRMAFDAAPEPLKREVCAEYVRVLQTSDDFEVFIYEVNFFRASDLAFMEAADASIAKKHLLAQVQGGLSNEYRATLAGIGRYADTDELTALVNRYLRYIREDGAQPRLSMAHALLVSLYQEAKEAGNGDHVMNRVTAYGQAIKAGSPVKDFVGGVIAAIQGDWF